MYGALEQAPTRRGADPPTHPQTHIRSERALRWRSNGKPLITIHESQRNLAPRPFLMRANRRRGFDGEIQATAVDQGAPPHPVVSRCAIDATCGA